MPLAAAMLKAQVDSLPEIKNRVEVSFEDFYTADSVEIILQRVQALSPDFIGFSTYLWNRDLVEELCRIVKTLLPDSIIFSGGAEATSLPENLLNSAPFDFVIRGEGELALTEVMKSLLDKKNFTEIPGVVSQNKISGISDNRYPVKDLDTLPSPFLSGVINLKKYSGVLWELSRGCPFKCSFCFESRGVAGVRQFSLDRLRKELELFEAENVTQVFVLDPTFNRDKNRAKKILRMILRTAPMIHFTFEARTEFIDNEMAGLFSKINCSLQIGLQSAIPEVLLNVNRKIDLGDYAAKISLLNDYGVVFGLDLIYGLPGDTLEGFKHSLDFALELQPNHLDVFPLAVLPGTELYDKAEFFNLNFVRNAPYTLVSSPGFSESDMSEAESLKSACNIFYNLGGAAGWMFMALETLALSPSELMGSFAGYLSDPVDLSDLTIEQITAVQLSFIRDLFKKHKKDALYPVMEDIIRIHGALNFSLHSGPFSAEKNTSFDENSLFKTSPSTVVLKLKYNYDELMTVGEYTFDEFIAHYNSEETFVVIYNCSGEVKPLVIDSRLSELLQSFTEVYPLKEFMKKNSSITHDEAYEFIEYALAETIIHTL